MGSTGCAERNRCSCQMCSVRHRAKPGIAARAKHTTRLASSSTSRSHRNRSHDEPLARTNGDWQPGAPAACVSPSKIASRAAAGRRIRKAQRTTDRNGRGPAANCCAGHEGIPQGPQGQALGLGHPTKPQSQSRKTLRPDAPCSRVHRAVATLCGELSASSWPRPSWLRLSWPHPSWLLWSASWLRLSWLRPSWLRPSWPRPSWLHPSWPPCR